jgi:serine/threonine protein kinase/Tfp pilus assembly protein PilF
MAQMEAQYLRLSYRSADKMNDPALLGGHYRPAELLGQGGVARVVLATDLLSGRKVALKMALEGNPEAAEAIKSEFRFAITHRHPSLVNPLGLTGDETQPIIIMPYAPGIPEDKVRSLLRSSVNHPQGAWIDDFIIEILECSAFIHFCGYLYNDFKPSNFIWRQDPDRAEKARPLLLDFNLVSRIGETLTKRGTIEYAPPEVLLGMEPTKASDLYSIGAMLYDLFAGTPPFVSEDSSILIKQITEDGAADLSIIPARLRDGIAALLSREPNSRPQDSTAAAEAFGLRSQFEELVKHRAGFYLSAGEPPFSNELKKACSDYLGGKSEKALLLFGNGCGTSQNDFLAAELALSGYQVERIVGEETPQAISATLEYLLASANQTDTTKIVLIIDDISKLDLSERCQLRALLRQPIALPVIACGKRWTSYDLSYHIFDPISNYSNYGATREALSAYLKKDTAVPENLSRAGGGDPELIFLHLSSAIKQETYDLLSPGSSLDFPLKSSPELEAAIERMLYPLDLSKQEMFAFMAAWGIEIPLILLTDFSTEQKNLVDILLGSGHLRRGKDSIFFPSEDARNYVYRRTNNEDRQRYHHFWAENTEQYLPQGDDFMETAAFHWGNSGNLRKGYNANLAAATNLFKKGELGRANVFAETLVSISRKGGGALSAALMISADILKQAGDYPAARRRYLELLRCLEKGSDQTIRAEAYKDMGDLYRSTKKPERALYYTRKALNYFEKLGLKQGVASCHNNIGLILWVNQEYHKALESFDLALAINERLGNFQEQAKIESNIGIIKEIMGRTAEVAGHFEKAYAAAQKAVDFWLEALIANNLGYYYIRHDELDKARFYLQKALEISEKISYTESTINALSNLGLCDLKSGDLFSSIDYCQRAMQMAKAIGNKHLSFDAQLFLSEIGILMGNFSLADSVLSSLEKDQIYIDNLVFARQVDVLRSRWQFSIGNVEIARRLATETSGYARTVGDSRLQLEAQLAFLATSMGDGNSIGQLRDLASDASTLGHNDLADNAALLLAGHYLALNNIESAEIWLERAHSKSNQGRRNRLEGRLILGRAKKAQKKYDEAINILTEIEIEAAGNGFLPDALEATMSLAEVYHHCGKISRAKEILKRADSYAQKITSSLPNCAAQGLWGNRPTMIELQTLREQIVEAAQV